MRKEILNYVCCFHKNQLPGMHPRESLSLWHSHKTVRVDTAKGLRLNLRSVKGHGEDFSLEKAFTKSRHILRITLCWTRLQSFLRFSKATKWNCAYISQHITDFAAANILVMYAGIIWEI